MAGYTLAQMKTFAMGNKTSTTRNPTRTGLVRIRDALVKQQGKVSYYVWGNLIAKYNPKANSLFLSDAGWNTKLTKDRLNSILPSGIYITQQKFKWYLKTNGKMIPWKGSITIKLKR